MNDELAHYGVKGMKWGVRRTLEQLGHKPKKKKSSSRQSSKSKPASKKKADAKKDKVERRKRALAIKKRRTMTDEELKKRIERLELEKKYKELSEKDLSAGKSFVKKILADSGQIYLKNATAGGMAYATRWATTGKFDWKELAEYIAPNPNKKK